jgi:hypothetical protein
MGMSEDDGKKWTLASGDSHLDYVRLDDAKSNLGKKRRDPRWFRREEVRIKGFCGDPMEVLRPVELEQKGKGRSDLLHKIAEKMAARMPPNVPHTLATIVLHLDKTEANAITHENRARTINKAFGKGTNEYLTDFGVLKRITRAGKNGMMLLLVPAPQLPQNGNEANPAS